jgi:F0F1-type ATP synthase assembly protein I
VVNQEPDSAPSAFAMAIGMIAGALIGFVLWIATDTFALFPAFLGVGLVIGMVLQPTIERTSGDPHSPGSGTNGE